MLLLVLMEVEVFLLLLGIFLAEAVALLIFVLDRTLFMLV